jgi:hypothetical protein
MGTASEVLIGLIQMWMLYQKQQGLSDAEINDSFTSTFTKFMAVSSVPIEPVKK